MTIRFVNNAAFQKPTRMLDLLFCSNIPAQSTLVKKSLQLKVRPLCSFNAFYTERANLFHYQFKNCG
jgi:hypothetical protein